jgi:hypothetical protein
MPTSFDRPYTIAVPHQRPATIWPGTGHDVSDLHSSHVVETGADEAALLIALSPDGTIIRHQAARIKALIIEQRELRADPKAAE